jgi:hypothetical protein
VDLQTMSPLSCAEAQQVLLIWEQQKDHCRFPQADPTVVVPTVRASPRQANAWIGTTSCPRPS